MAWKNALASATLALLLAACNGENGTMGPSGMGTGSNGQMGANAPNGTMLTSVFPAGGALVVPTMVSVSLRFSGPVGSGMERYVDLHLGDVSGPVVPMSCRLSVDRTLVTCSPDAPLQARTRYTLHVGAGMLDTAGRPIDMGYGMGGQLLMGGMMGPTHGGVAWNNMAAPWMGANGSYGMAFSFTTA